jgi:hypothetical protein
MATGTPRWAITDLSGNAATTPPTAGAVVVTIADTVVPVVGIQLYYGINSIPQVTVTLAVGRNIRTLQQSTVAATASKFKQMAKIVVYIQGDLGAWSPAGDRGQQKKWPTPASPINPVSGTPTDPSGSSNLAILFTGYVSSISFKRSAQAVALQVSAVSRLIDLNMSSVGSVKLMPGSPLDFHTPTVHQNTGVKAQSAVFSFSTSLNADATMDFAGGLLKVLQNIANDEGELQLHGKVPGLENAKNTAALDVIKPTFSDPLNAGTADFSYWKGMNKFTGGYLDKWVTEYPLAIDSTSTSQLVNEISNMVNSSRAGSTFWNVLVGSVLPAVGMGLVPLARAAIIAPLMPLNRKWSFVLQPNEYADFHATTLAQRPLYGVGLYGTSTSGTGVFDPTVNSAEVGSHYVANLKGEGAWMFFPRPSWLDDLKNRTVGTTSPTGSVVADVMNNAIPTLGVAGLDNLEATNTAIRNIDAETVQRLTEVKDQVGDAASRYAKMLYVANALRGRDYVVTTKLRFDIAPGCTILLKGELTADNGLGQEGTDYLDMDAVAFVTKVAITIDVESQRASTSLTLANVRTAEENKDPSFAIDEHPFFDDKFFSYAPLVPELSFDPIGV